MGPNKSATSCIYFCFSFFFQVLPGSSKSKSTAGASKIERTAQIRAITVAFLSEWCLPFSLAENLLNYAKLVSKDMAALQKTTISRTSASYITTWCSNLFQRRIETEIENQGSIIKYR